MKDDSVIRLNLYFPKEAKLLYEKIAYLAKRNMRSMNMECIVLLTQIVEQLEPDLRDFKESENLKGL